MNNKKIDQIVEQLRQGKRCYFGFDAQELSTVATVEQNAENLYTYARWVSHKYDVVSPAHNEKRVLNEAELRKLLSDLSEEVLNNISYKDKDAINENTQKKVDLIYSYLKQGPKVVYVVFKGGRNPDEKYMNFNSLFKEREQAEQMVEYLRQKQGVPSYWREVTLTLREQQIELQAELSAYDRLTSKQILITLLDMEPNKLETFFEG